MSFFLFETETTQALFNDQRMEKQEPSSQINFFYNILHLKSRYLENNVSALKNECLEMVKYIYLVGEKYICMRGNSITIYFVNIFILSSNIKFIYWCVIPYSRYSTKGKNDWQNLGSQIIPGQHLTCVSTPTLAPSAEQSCSIWCIYNWGNTPALYHM